MLYNFVKQELHSTQNYIFHFKYWNVGDDDMQMKEMKEKF